MLLQVFVPVVFWAVFSFMRDGTGAQASVKPMSKRMPEAVCEWDFTDKDLVALTLIDGDKHDIATIKRRGNHCTIAVSPHANAYVRCYRDENVLSVSALFPSFEPGETRSYVCNATKYDEEYKHETYTTNASRTVHREDNGVVVQGHVSWMVVAIVFLPANIHEVVMLIRAKCRARTDRNHAPKQSPQEEPGVTDNLITGRENGPADQQCNSVTQADSELTAVKTEGLGGKVEGNNVERKEKDRSHIARLSVNEHAPSPRSVTTAAGDIPCTDQSPGGGDLAHSPPHHAETTPTITCTEPQATKTFEHTQSETPIHEISTNQTLSDDSGYGSRSTPGIDETFRSQASVSSPTADMNRNSGMEFTACH